MIYSGTSQIHRDNLVCPLDMPGKVINGQVVEFQNVLVHWPICLGNQFE
jgi:hypothetical protein